MSTSIDVAFIKQWEAEHHTAYQRRGSQLRNFVRTSTKQPGADITFHVAGKGTASSKSRHGDVPTMNQSHTTKTVTLVDSFAADYIDSLDLLKTNLDERRVITDGATFALGRKTDQHIVDALDTATNNTAVNLSAVTTATLIGMTTRLGARDVPVGDGNLFAAVSFELWGKMLTIQEFNNSQWVGPDALPFKTGIQAKMWNGVIWTPFSGLTIAANVRKNYMWHRTAIGHGIAAEVGLDVSWENTKDAWFVKAKMSQGGVLIDDNGVERLSVTENA